MYVKQFGLDCESDRGAVPIASPGGEAVMVIAKSNGHD